MDIHYQVLNFDRAKTLRVVDHVRRELPDLAGKLKAVVIGDFSCSYRNQHTMAKLEEGTDLDEFLDAMRERGLPVLYQLPLVVKELELPKMKDFIQEHFERFDGFVTGDLGVIRFIDRLVKAGGSPKKLIYTSNVLNSTLSAFLEQTFAITAVRPLMHKRTYIEQDVSFPKDVVIYGNMMINCSTFCFHCGDLPTKCDFSCEEPKQLIMENELMHMVGRSLITENRLDLLERLPRIPDVRSVTIMDLDLGLDEIEHVFRTVAAQG